MKKKILNIMNLRQWGYSFSGLQVSDGQKKAMAFW